MQPSFPEATFNLGNALFRGQKAEEAARAYGEIAADSLASPEMRSAASYNIGNVMLAGQKPDEAIEAYKAALRIDPTDMEAKYNLAYARKLKQDQQQQDQQQNGEGEGDSEQNQDKNQEGEGQQDPQQNDGDKPDDMQPEEYKPAQPQYKTGSGEAKIDPSTAEQMLEAVQSEEDKTREKINAREVPRVGRSGKNW
jgi:tetratricopeptide (TPR) repeat protein